MERKSSRWTKFTACALLACTAPALAGTCKLAKWGTLPVQVIGEKATTQIKVNGVDTSFILDTGAFFNFMSRADATALKLPLSPPPYDMRIRGIGGSSDVKVARVNDFGMLDTTFHNVLFLVGGSDAGRGALGANMLDSADLELDLAHGKVTLFQSEGCGKAALAYWSTGRNYEVADLHPDYANENDKRTFVDVMINGKSFRALLDSGADATMIDRRAAERAGIDLHGPGVKAGPRIHGIGAQSDQTWIVPVDKFSVGTETIQHSQMLVMDNNFGDGSTDMILGIDFMLAHHIYIANSQKKMYFTYNGGRVFSLDTRSIGANEPASSATTAIAASAAPKTAADYALSGQAHLARGELADARSDLDAAIRLDPNNASDYLVRARILGASKQPEAALADLDKAIQLDPKNFGALLMRARLRYAKKDLTGAAADIASARPLAPSGSMQSMAIARLYVAVDQPAAALPLMDAWIHMHPDDATLGGALNARCWARTLANQNLKGALHDCRKAIKRDGDRPAYEDSLGLVYLRLGDDAESIKAYQQALTHLPKSAWTHYGMGLAELHSGQTSAGEAQIDEARSLDKSIDTQIAKYGLIAANTPAQAASTSAPPAK